MPDEQTTVYLGNRDAVEVTHDDHGRETRTPLPGNRCTTVQPPAGTSMAEIFATITAPRGVWAYHSDSAPAWVASTDPALAQLLAAHYGCEVRDPEPDQPAAADAGAEAEEV
ncbi:hypothetical protein [Actinomadura litoris]|uniref:Uncharacterized protein n=1 Tax=Actinomadura litoris TaxID=2678616 RepID=A0A7K1LAG8_9ACTN|nr:hypothetical protein [Actinomadura litoris]MUN41419.1 hypothetical protein [Actinomadura litoris]